MMRKIGVLIALMAMVFVTAAEGAGQGQDHRALRGTYALNGTRVCTYTSQGGFGPAPTYTLSDDATTRTAIFTGELNLNGDGTGTAVFKLMQFVHQLVAPGNQSMSVAEIECTVSYGNLPDGTLELSTSNCGGPVTAGLGTGLFVTDSGEVTLTVSTNRNGSVLLLSNVDPTINEITAVFPPPPDTPSFTSTSNVLCARSFTAVLVAPYE